MATAPVRAVERRRSALRSERRFYVGAAVAVAAIVLTGFARTYYLKGYFHTPALLPIIHLHAVLFSSWVALFITQTWLVSARRTRVHMRLGIAGFVLAVAMIVVGTIAAVTVAKLGHVRPGGPPPLFFLVVPIFDMLVFAVLIAAGFRLRRRPDYHKRVMLVATASLMTAAVGRLIVLAQGHANVWLALTFTSLLVALAAAWDTALHRRLHPAFAWAGALVIVSVPLRFAVAHTDTWMAFARWLTS
jgi:hypothetical protein